MRRRYQLILIILMFAMIAGLYLVYANRNQPLSTPVRLYDYSFSQQYAGIWSDVLNASQGTAQQVNLTFTSMSSSTIAIPIENLTFKSFNSTNYSNNYDNRDWNTSVAPESVFNYSFSLSQPTLQPGMSNSTVLTIKWTDGTPTGSYIFEIDLGNVKFLSAQEKYEQSYGATIEVGITVTPKES